MPTSNGPSSVGGEHDPESVVMKVFEAVARRRTFSMIRLAASVPPLDQEWKLLRTSAISGPCRVAW
jgi:hypothetical protein